MTQPAASDPPALRGVRDRIDEYRTWGRWGTDDELGSLNYVGSEQVRRAAGLVREGRVFSLALPLDRNGPQSGLYGRTNPALVMLADGGDILAGAQDQPSWGGLQYCDDAIFMPLQAATQWDAFSHIFFEGQGYNGRTPDTVTSLGAAHNSITAVKDRALGRGVLLDIACHVGVDWLEGTFPIGHDLLDECAQAQGVDVGEGDFVLVRTGSLARTRAEGSWAGYVGGGANPGLDISAADFLCPRHVAAVATDTSYFEVEPSHVDGVWQPLHVIFLVNAGILVGEMWDLEELAAACSGDGVYDFMLVAQPLTISGAVGSPLNPLAIR